MTERFAQYDGGKGPEDRSDVNKRANSPLWKVVKLSSGVSLAPEDAAAAIDWAMHIITAKDNMLNKVAKHEANHWLKQYYNTELE